MNNSFQFITWEPPASPNDGIIKTPTVPFRDISFASLSSDSLLANISNATRVITNSKGETKIPAGFISENFIEAFTNEFWYLETLTQNSSICGTYSCNPYSCNPSDCNPFYVNTIPSIFSCNGIGGNGNCYAVCAGFACPFFNCFCYNTCFQTCFQTCSYSCQREWYRTYEVKHRYGYEGNNWEFKRVFYDNFIGIPNPPINITT